MKLWVSVGLLLCWSATVDASNRVDLKSLQRIPLKEPDFKSEEPLYALAVFGNEGKTQIWLALDQSAAGDGAYDVVYVDLNGDGDLRDEGERFIGKVANGTAQTSFDLGDFTDPHTGAKHTQMTLRLTEGQRPLHMLKLKWRDKHFMAGGYAKQGGGGYMRFAPSPEKAPIVWFNGDGPFRFQRWYSAELRIGQADDLKVFLGQIGVGENSFCAFTSHVLPPEEGVTATLIYSDAAGKQHRETCYLKQRC